MVTAQGDGWVRGYEAKTGKKLWEFDTNPKDSVWPKTRNEVIATPVIYEDRVYIANGQDPEHGEGVGHFYAIDATKRGDITAERPHLALRQDPPHRSRPRRSRTASSTSPTSAASCTASTPRPASRYWTHDMFAAIWGSPLVVDGKVYLGDEDGDVVVLAARQGEEGPGRERTWAARSTRPPVPANGALFIMNRNQLWSLAEGGSAPAAGQ